MSSGKGREAPAAPPNGSGGSGEVAIEVRDLSKTFHIPTGHSDTLKDRILHPRRSRGSRELKVLDGISFQVRRGEFFGVVGRNGSGKSTLLKLLGNIYRFDSGRIRVAGSVAPIIELGVGFHPEMTAKENVLLNGLMHGLSARECRRRFDSVIDFSELHDFLDLKVKNYSAGMKLRLAFAVMLETDPDIVLLDEVLAVGDPGFQRKCHDAFDEFRRRGEKTVLLVSQDVRRIDEECERALMLKNGRIECIGETSEVARRYMELIEAGAPHHEASPELSEDEMPTRIVHARLIDSAGSPIHSVESGAPLRLHVSVQAEQPIQNPRLLLRIGNASGAALFVPEPIDLGDFAQQLTDGGQVGIGTRIENRLRPGPYVASFVVAGRRGEKESIVSEHESLKFEVLPDGRPGSGLVSLDYSVDIRAEQELSPTARES